MKNIYSDNPHVRALLLKITKRNIQTQELLIEALKNRCIIPATFFKITNALSGYKAVDAEDLTSKMALDLYSYKKVNAYDLITLFNHISAAEIQIFTRHGSTSRLQAQLVLAWLNMRYWTGVYDKYKDQNTVDLVCDFKQKQEIPQVGSSKRITLTSSYIKEQIGDDMVTLMRYTGAELGLFSAISSSNPVNSKIFDTLNYLSTK